jgi:hypothetical protein
VVPAAPHRYVKLRTLQGEPVRRCREHIKPARTIPTPLHRGRDRIQETPRSEPATAVVKSGPGPADRRMLHRCPHGRDQLQLLNL